jgi:hypothetical protein
MPLGVRCSGWFGVTLRGHPFCCGARLLRVYRDLPEQKSTVTRAVERRSPWRALRAAHRPAIFNDVRMRIRLAAA